LRGSGFPALARPARLVKAALEISPIFAWRRVIMALFLAAWDYCAGKARQLDGAGR
jgi:hypothetical protein